MAWRLGGEKQSTERAISGETEMIFERRATSSREVVVWQDARTARNSQRKLPGSAGLYAFSKGEMMNANFSDDREQEIDFGRENPPNRKGERFRMTRHRSVVKRNRPKQANGIHKRRQKRTGL